MSDLKPKVGEWWVCEHISIMGNGDSISAYKMTPGLIIAGNVKPIERLYSKQEHDRMVEEIAELKGDSLELIKAIKFLYKNTRHISELQSKNIESMIEYHEAKLNQEGGE